MNITLIIVVLIILAMAVRGFRKGFIKEVSEIISFVVVLFTILLLIMLYMTFQNKEIGNLLITLVILLSASFGYFLLKVLLKSLKLLLNLPILKFVNKVMGSVSGIAEGILIVWILYLLNEYNLFGSYSDIIRIHTMGSDLLTFIYENNYLIKVMFL